MSERLDTRFEPEPERYEFKEKPRYQFDVSRRTFVQVLGAGLLITANGGIAFAQGRSRSGRAPKNVAARLHIGDDGTVTLLTSKVEVGQGSRTQLAQAAAEELRLPLDRIRVIMADTDAVPNDGGTFGSLTTPRTVPAVRKAAATARDLLRDAACAKWGVKPSAVKLQDGLVNLSGTNKTFSYAELAKTREVSEAFEGNLPSEVEVTAVEEWKVLGEPTPKSNGINIVTGKHRYPSDIVRPNMLYGKVLRPPAYGATLRSVDLSAAKAMKGVVAVHDGQFAGCAAPTTYEAEKALEAIAKTAEWEHKPHPASSELFAHLKNLAEKAGSGGRRPRVRSRGSIEDGLKQSKTILKATYKVPYIQHTPMEPRAAVAEESDGKLTVWTGTQRPYGVRGELARAFSIPRERVRVIVPDTGGGFGGKHTGDAALEAARLARAAGRPVSVRWTREEEFTWAYFRPAGLIEATAGLDKAGQLVAWDFTNINSGASALESPYAIPNVKTQFVFCDSPLREGSYRSLAATANTFAREAFMDELAKKAGADPLAFRLRHLDNPRMRAVLEAAARGLGFEEAKAATGNGIGVGIACGTDKGSFVAACVEVDVSKGLRRLNVRRVCQAFECGAIQNPTNLRSQVEGALIMGLGGALTEHIEFENGVILNATLKKYEVPRFKDVPDIEIVLLDRPDLPSVGAGETPIIAIAPAIANAIYDATGSSLRAMPFRIGDEAEA